MDDHPNDPQIQLQNLLKDQLMAKPCNALVIGDAILDRHIYTQRVVRPRPREPLVTVLQHNGDGKPEESMRSCLGGAALMARALKGLGAGKVTLCGIIGSADEAGRKLKKHLADGGIDFKGLTTTSQSDVVTRYYAQTVTERYAESVRVAHNRWPLASLHDMKALARKIKEALKKKPDVLLLADYHRGVLCPDLFEYENLIECLQEIPLIVMGGHSCSHRTIERLGRVDLVALNIFELWRTLRDMPWERLDKEKPRWLDSEQPPKFDKAPSSTPSAEQPSLLEEFAEKLMTTCPGVQRFFINQTLGHAIAIERDPDQHGRYQLALVPPSEWRTVTSVVGADALATAFGSLSLKKNKSQKGSEAYRTEKMGGVNVSKFFAAAYAMKYVSGAQLTEPGENLLDIKQLKEQLNNDTVERNWPLPAFHPPEDKELEEERAIGEAIEKLKEKIDLTGLPDYRQFHAGSLKGCIDAAETKLSKAKEQAKQPIRLWIHGPSGTGKEVLADAIACQLGYNGVVKVQHDERRSKDFTLTSRFAEANRDNKALMLNEIDKGMHRNIQGELLTLLDDTGRRFPGLLVIGIASAEDQEDGTHPGDDQAIEAADIEKLREGMMDLPHLLGEALIIGSMRERKEASLLPDTYRRFYDGREDAASIEIPHYKDRMGDLPYLLGIALAKEGQYLPGVKPPGAISKAALELLLRAPALSLVHEWNFTFTNIQEAARYLLREAPAGDTIYLSHIAPALRLEDLFKIRNKDLVPVYGREEKDERKLTVKMVGYESVDQVDVTEQQRGFLEAQRRDLERILSRWDRSNLPNSKRVGNQLKMALSELKKIEGTLPKAKVALKMERRLGRLRGKFK